MGGKSDAPAAPDYIGQANAQAAGNLTAARATTAANRVNQVTPYGSIKYTQGTGFDQAGYDKAQADYDNMQATLDGMTDKVQAQQLRDYHAQMAGLQAQDQFFKQGIAGNQATLQQRNFLRSIPLNELNALRTGSQVTNPTFSSPGQQGQTSGPDLLGASKSQYDAQVGGVNAENAQKASNTQAGVGLAASALAYFF
jgi:hypothetical protein